MLRALFRLFAGPPITQVGVIFNSASRIVQSINILEEGEDDSMLGTVVALPQPGQELALVSLALLPFDAIGRRDCSLANIIAVRPDLREPLTCHVIDEATGQVVNTVRADPDWYRPPGYRVVPVEGAGV